MTKRLSRMANGREALRDLRTLWRFHGVPPHQAIADFLRLRRLIDCSRHDFFTNGLWDRTLPEMERRRFLCERDRVAIELRMNPEVGQRMLQDKSKVAADLSAAGLAGPDILAVVGAGARPEPAHPLIETEESFRELLAGDHPDGLVCKPVFGMAGSDVHVFPVVGPDGLVHADGTRWTVERLWRVVSVPGEHAAAESRHAKEWQIERRTPPHPALAAVHGDTLGCIRVVTIRFADGTIEFLDPTWKIPVGSAGVDNLDFGSLTAPVELTSGTVGRQILQGTMVRHDSHPLTGARLTGLILPEWPSVLQLARDAMALYPPLRSLGFDIGVTIDGARIVEVNPYWGIQMMQGPQGRGVLHGRFLEFLEELGAEDVIRRKARGL
jgi:hypothetical protein